MGKIIDILETERKRPTAADFDVVHMYKTGQFYTAYDWSRCQRCASSLLTN